MLAVRRALPSEKGPSNISEVASVLEKDNVHLRVEQCGDQEGLSLACLQENTETRLLNQHAFIERLFLKSSSS